jgi:hypothetical protein
MPGDANAESFDRETSSAYPKDEGVIIGLVIDEAIGRPIRGVEVTVTCECLTSPLATVSNDRGIYQFSNLPAGTHLVRASVGDVFVEKTVSLASGGKVRSDLLLELHDGEQLIIVVAPSIAEPRHGCGHCTADRQFEFGEIFLLLALFSWMSTRRSARHTCTR